MNNKLKIIFAAISIMSVVFISCKEESPVEPEIILDGYIIGKVIQQGNEEPVQNVNISTDPATSFVTTDAFGNYMILNVDSGLYRVTAQKLGFISVTANVSLSHGDTAFANFVLRLDPNVEPIPDEDPGVGSILGIVRDADSNAPLSQVNITTNPVTGSIITNSQGEFYITDLAAGRYTVKAKKNYYDSTSVTVSVTLGDTTTANIFMNLKDTSTAVTTGIISGHIYNSVTGDPIKQASISTTPTTSVLNTDSTGYFKITNVVAGAYTLNVSRLGFTTQSVSILVQAGRETIADINMMPTTGSIRGTVKQFQGYEIYGATIRTQPSTKNAFSDRSGKFSIDNINVGEYQVITTHTSYAADTTSVSVEPGSVIDIIVILNAP